MAEPTNGSSSNGHSPVQDQAAATRVVNANGNGNGAPTAPVDPATFSLRERALVDNAVTLLRSELSRAMLDPRRNINHECGYPGGIINPELYKELYDRDPIAGKVVEVLPKECWQVQPAVYEDVDSEERTPFEVAWDELGKTLKTGGTPSYYKEEIGSAVWQLLLHADVLSGLGSYGVIYLAFDDIGKVDPETGMIKTPMDPAPGCYEQSSQPAGWSPKINQEGTGFLTTNTGKKDFFGNDIVEYEKEFVKPPPFTGQYRMTFNYWAGSPGATQPGYWNPLGGGHEYYRPGLEAEKPQYRYQGDGLSGQYKRLEDGRNVPIEAQYRAGSYSPSGEQGGGGNIDDSKPRTGLLFARVLPEHLAQITRYESNMSSPRFGMPAQYLLTFNDMRDQFGAGIGMVFASMPVHWSRVVHIADTNHTAPVNPYLAVPRMRPVLNRLLDLVKVYGADAEGWWRNCALKLFLETHPELGGDVRINESKLRDMMEQMFNGQQSWAWLGGLSAKPVSPAVSNPTEHTAVQLEAICIKLSIPLRIFKGSERGELASSQDDDAWNDRLKLRQQTYITPGVICPFIDRLIICGVLPMPGQAQRDIRRKHQQAIQEGRNPNPSELVPGDMLTQELAKLYKARSSQAPGSNAAPGDPTRTKFPPKPPYGTSPENSPVDPDQQPMAGGVTAPGQPPPTAPGQPPAHDPTPIEHPPMAPPGIGGAPGRTREEQMGLDSEEGGTLYYQPYEEEDNPGYVVDWPDLTSQSGEQKAAEAGKWVQTMVQYISGDCQTLMAPKDFLVRFMNMDEEEAQTILDNVSKQLQESDTPPMVSRMTMPAIRGLMELLKLAGAGGLTEEQLKGYMSLFFKLDDEQIEDLLVGGIQKPDPQAMAAAGGMGGKGGFGGGGGGMGGGGGGMGGGGGGGMGMNTSEEEMITVPPLGNAEGEWDESKHDRDASGKFGSGSRGSGRGGSGTSSSQETGARLSAKVAKAAEAAHALDPGGNYPKGVASKSDPHAQLAHLSQVDTAIFDPLQQHRGQVKAEGGPYFHNEYLRGISDQLSGVKRAMERDPRGAKEHLDRFMRQTDALKQDITKGAAEALEHLGKHREADFYNDHGPGLVKAAQDHAKALHDEIQAKRAAPAPAPAPTAPAQPAPTKKGLFRRLFGNQSVTNQGDDMDSDEFLTSALIVSGMVRTAAEARLVINQIRTIAANDTQWDESKHERDASGRFGSGGGGGGTATKAKEDKGSSKGPGGTAKPGQGAMMPTGSCTTCKDPTSPPPPGKVYHPDVTHDHNGDGIADAARVGVDAMNVPKKVGQLPNLTPYEREVESAFREMYESDPKGTAGKYLELVKAAAGPGKPPTFETDGAKNLTDVWTHPHQETRAENRATLNTALHQTANAITKAAFLQHLDTLKPGDNILVTVGGCGAGKGFSMGSDKSGKPFVPQAAELKGKAKVVWDSAGDQNATENPWIQREAEKRGLNVTYLFVHADPYTQWAHPERGVVKRAQDPKDGRMVDAKVFADSYAMGAKNHDAFHQANKDNPNARFVFTDNTGGKPKLVDGVPQSAKELDRDHLEKYALHTLRESDAPPHVKRGATVGQRIWQ